MDFYKEKGLSDFYCRGFWLLSQTLHTTYAKNGNNNIRAGVYVYHSQYTEGTQILCPWYRIRAQDLKNRHREREKERKRERECVCARCDLCINEAFRSVH